jgi:hypothetical protein
MTPQERAELRVLLDERAIERAILRYCRGIDRLDRDLVRSCYHADATDHHGSFSGGVEAYLDWVWKLLERYESTMHFVGNVLIDIEGDAARAESYGIAFHRGDPAVPERNLITGFRYVDRFERRDDDWRIAQRVATTEWVRRDDPALWWEIKENLPRGRRDRSDPVYEPL